MSFTFPTMYIFLSLVHLTCVCHLKMHIKLRKSWKMQSWRLNTLDVVYFFLHIYATNYFDFCFRLNMKSDFFIFSLKYEWHFTLKNDRKWCFLLCQLLFEVASFVSNSIIMKLNQLTILLQINFRNYLQLSCF